ncbi:unnamed protein product [Prunus armeniaca]
MVTIFKSYGLWNLVEKGIPISYSKKKKKKKKASEEISEEENDKKAAAILMKDAKALGIIQNAVSDQIFPRIANADFAKVAWELLYGEFHGGDHVRSVKLQNLLCEFEYTRMHDNESLSAYLTRLNDLINQMKTYGEVLSNERLVQKVLISLSKIYDPICLVIENTKSLEIVELQEVIAILKSEEQRFELHNVDAIEKAFASFTVQKARTKGKPWESKGKSQQNNPAPAHNFSSSQPASQEGVKPQCKVCSKFGHLARECTAGKSVQKANCANQVEVTGNLFYANCATIEANPNGDWYIDSGYSNHMTDNVDLLVDVRTNVAGHVQMPTGVLVKVAGMRSLIIETTKGRKYIREVMYLPGLRENLLSVGQMDEHGYFLVFGDGMCKVFDSSSLNCLIIKVPMKKNRCYPLSLLAEN